MPCSPCPETAAALGCLPPGGRIEASSNFFYIAFDVFNRWRGSCCQSFLNTLLMFCQIPTRVVSLKLNVYFTLVCEKCGYQKPFKVDYSKIPRIIDG